MRSYVLLAALGSTALTVRLYVLQAALGYTVVRSEPAKMSSKKRRRLTPQANDIATDAVQLIRERANGNDGIFNEACLACTDQPGFLSALGIPGTGYKDMQAAATLLAMSRKTFAGRLSTSGSRSEGARQQAQSIAAGLHSAEVSVERAQTIAGIPRMTWEAGGRLAEKNDGASSAAQKSTLGITEHKDHVPWENVWDWYHTDSPLVEINKQTKRQYTRKKFQLPDGKELSLTCELRTRSCGKEELARSFCQSDLHARLTQQGYSISERGAQACICDCIKEVSQAPSMSYCVRRVRVSIQPTPFPTRFRCRLQNAYAHFAPGSASSSMDGKVFGRG